MSKKFYSFWNLLLGSFITLLGFTACKTTKKVQAPDEDLVLYGPPPPPTVIEKPKPDEPIKLLYGAPPVKAPKQPEVIIE